MKTAMGSTSALLAYLGLLNDEYNFGQYTIRTHDLSQYLRLDNSALRALSLFPEPGQTGSNKNMSIFGLLNRCKTAQGVRMLGQWLKQPLVNVHAIGECRDAVAAEDRASTGVSSDVSTLTHSQRNAKIWSKSSRRMRVRVKCCR